MAAATPSLVTDDATLSPYDRIITLASALTNRAHVFVDGLHDESLREQCVQVLKSGFDRALATEPSTFPHLSNLLSSLSSPGVATRSRSHLQDDEPTATQLVPTPLAELTTEGMDAEMIWEQMEMRNAVVGEVLEEMFGDAQEDEEGAEESAAEDESDDEDEDDEEMDDGSDFAFDEDEDDDDDESQDTEDELAVERFVEMEPFEAELGKPTPGWPVKLEQGAQPEPEGDEEEDPDADESKGLTLDNFDGPLAGRGSKRTGPVSAVDDDFFSLHDFHQQVDEGEAEMDRMLRGEVDSDDEDANDEDGEGVDLFAPIGGSKGGGDGKDEEDEEEDEDEDLDAAGIMYSDFFDPPPRPLGKQTKKSGGGQIEKEKKMRIAAAKKAVSANGGQGTSTITVVQNLVPALDSDSAPTTPNGTKRGVMFAEKVKVKLIPPRGGRFARLVEEMGYERAEKAFEEMQQQDQLGDSDEDDQNDGDGDEDDEDDAGEGESEGEEEEAEDAEMEAGDVNEEEDEDDEDGQADFAEEEETMQRVSSSLFDDEDEEEAEESKGSQLSRHERRLMQLSWQIAALEAENVGVKNWATKGEAKARDRPTNSLLDEDLEFERMGKVVPVITEESTKTIEDLIKKRILEDQFDDVERRRPVDPHAFLPSRFVELQDTKSNKSLAEIYEEDYQTAKAKDAGENVVHELDSALEAKHQEIEDLFDDLAAKLDALSNARFTPKPPKSAISTITNLPSLALESALPPTQSAAAMLAPEEVFVPDPTNEDRSDFTPAQKKAARQKRRKARAAVAQQVERLKESKGVKGEKEKATKMLVGQKGVTVLGKGGKKVEAVNGKKRKRSEGDIGEQNGVRLKL